MNEQTIECPACGGETGGKDAFGGWDDCDCCDGAGRCTPSQYDKWEAEQAADQ